MTLLFYAQPYDISAEGFYFRTVEEYTKRAATLKNDFDQPVEEFEIQFIDGEDFDCELAKAIGINQANLKQFFELSEEWEDHEKIRYIIAIGECGYDFDIDKDNIELLEVDIYEEDSMKDLAIRFVDDGLYGEVPEPFQFYIDYDAIARDLAIEYSQIKIGNERLIYRCS